MLTDAAVRPAERSPLLPLALIFAGLAAVSVTVYLGRGVEPAAALLLLLALVGAGYRALTRWELTIGLVLVVVLFIPIKRYQFAASLPFDLEPYRILVAVVVFMWVAALLVDPRVELRRSAFDGPLLLLAFAVIGSVALNADKILGIETSRRVELSDNIAKELLFILSFFLLFYFLVSVMRTSGVIHAVLKTLVLGAAVVAFFAIVERRTRYNVFDNLGGWVPFLEFEGGLTEEGIRRGGRLRVYGPAQHPIALAAMLAMMVPLSIYLANHFRRRGWYLATALLLFATLATVSRTAVLMLATIGIVSMALRPAIVRPLVIALLPALLAVHLVIPGAIGGLSGAFFPREGLIANQTKFGGRASGERLAPQFEVIRERPAFGQGYGTRLTTGPEVNARILDNQWLGTAVEIGLVGITAWVWLFVHFLLRAGRAAKSDLSGRGALLTALAGSVTAFAVAMFTFDAFSFIQVTVVLFVLLALGASTLATREPWPPPPSAGG